MTQAPEITAKSWAMVGLLGFVWGGTFMVTEVALEGITPFWLAASRITLAALVSGAIWQMMGGRLFLQPASRGDWMRLCIIAALSSAIPFSLLAWGQQYVTAGFAGVSMASVALVVLPLAHFLVPGEKVGPRRAIGFVIGFAGVVTLIGAQAFESTGASLELPGRIACIGAATCYALSSILMRRLPPIDPIGLSTMLVVVGTCITIPSAWLVEGPPPLPDTRTLWVIAFLGLVPTAAANVLRVLVVRSAGPVFMSLTNYQVPLWSVLLGVWLLGEPVPNALVLAMVLILAGVALSQSRALAALFRR